MKLEKKHYYWIGGVIIALILLYIFRKRIFGKEVPATTAGGRIAPGTASSKTSGCACNVFSYLYYGKWCPGSQCDWGY